MTTTPTTRSLEDSPAGQELGVIPCTSSSTEANGRKSKRILGPNLVEQRPCLAQNTPGEVLRSRTIGPFTLTENVYAAGSQLPKYTYPAPHIMFVIEGVVRETFADKPMMTCRAGSLRFLPAGEVHADEIESRVRCLDVRIAPEMLRALGCHAVIPRKPAQVGGLTATWLANRLYAEFAREDIASAIAVEGLVLEILAEIARAENKPDTVFVPNWLKHATDIVESRFLERLSLADIASEVGVHYVHLSRQFHKYNRCTIGELIRKRRVQHASHLLAHSQTPLAEIALICGFSDQSHLSFLFKRYMGVSPSKFRHLAGLGQR